MSTAAAEPTTEKPTAAEPAAAEPTTEKPAAPTSRPTAASNPVTEQVRAENEYQPPRTHIGMMLYWYGGASTAQAPVPALVISKGGKTVDLKLFLPKGRESWKSGVRHVHDPHFRVRPRVAAEVGGWAYSPEARLLVELLPDATEPNQEEQAIVKMLAEGATAAKTAEHFGTTYQRVNGINKRFGE